MAMTEPITVKISEETRRLYGQSPNHGTLLCWNWCVENLGNPEPYGSKWSWDTIRTFQFSDAEDAIMFRLMWA